jgi:hypothetical protein
MRWLYACIGVIGGVLGLAAAYFFFMFAMFMGGGGGTVGTLVLYVIIAVVLAALLNLLAGLFNPRKATARWMLLISAAIWPLGAVLLGIARSFDAGAVSAANTVMFVALLAAPALLPLAAWAFARWKFAAA